MTKFDPHPEDQAVLDHYSRPDPAASIADELIALCEAAARRAKRTGDTFVLDRSRLVTFIRTTLSQHVGRTDAQTVTSGVKP